MKFFKESIKNLKVSGSIKPSSKSLIQKCLKNVDFEKSDIILEFGVGDGCITEEILKKIKPNARLIALEINENLVSYTRDRFKEDARLELHHASAFDFDKILESEEIEKVDFIISSLPLSLFKREEIDNLFDKVPHYLTEDGAYIQYQYTLGKYAYLKKVFNKVKVDFTIRNTPPALIFTCLNL